MIYQEMIERIGLPWRALCIAPDDDGAGGGGGGGGAAGSEGEAADSAAEGGEGGRRGGNGLLREDDGAGDDADGNGNESARTEDGTLTRPDGIPEKFWDGEKNAPRVDALAKAYTTLEAAHAKLKSERGGGAPEKAEDYFADGFQVPDGADRVREIASDDPALSAVAKVMHKHDMSAEKGRAFVADMLTALNPLLPPPVDIEAERAALGDNAKAQVGAAKSWLIGLETNGVLSKDEVDFALDFGATAIGVRTLNKLRTLAGEKPIPTNFGDVPDGLPSKEEWYRLAADDKWMANADNRNKHEEWGEAIFGTSPSGTSEQGLGMR